MKKLLLILGLVITMMGGEWIMERKIVCGEPRINRKIIQAGTPIEFVKIVPETVNVAATQAGLLVLSRSFSNLYISKPDITYHQVTISADGAILRNAQGLIITIPQMSVVNNLTTAGPTPGGRDQASALSGWFCYLYLIYNSGSQIVSSLSSNSSTAPTLPTGYDYFARCGAAALDSGIFASWTLPKAGLVTYSTMGFSAMGPTVADTFEVLYLTAAIPPTAKRVFGFMGLETNPVVSRGMTVAADSDGLAGVTASLQPGAAIAGYGPSASVWFDIPLITPQEIYWKASSTSNIFDIVIAGWSDEY